MNKINLKNLYLNLAIILIVFIFDRTTKLYILKLAEVEASVDIYITSYLNLFLIWNKGIAFGLFSIDGSIIYNFYYNLNWSYHYCYFVYDAEE